ncbi:MAG: thioredoxin domain-containing protein, partial [Pirellulaceae bacterium]
RQRPLTDEKILTSWNGLMIRGLADSGRIFDRPDYVEMAVRAADFVLAELRTDEGRLQRTYGKGHAKLNAYLNDSAFLTYGLIGLHQATGEPRWLSAALQITDKQLELFWDESGKGFFFTSSDHESLLARAKNPHDGAQPSGNSIAAVNLPSLATATNGDSYRQYAKETVEAMAGLTKQFPAAAPLLGVAAADLAGEQE